MLAGMAMSMSHAATVSWDISSPGTNNQQAGYTGFSFTLSNTTWLTGNADIPASVSLTSIDINIAPTWYTAAKYVSTGHPLGVAIMESNESGGWSYVGKSDTWLTNAAVSAKTNSTFEFSNLVLDSSKTYTLVFIGDKTYFDAMTTGTVLTSLAGTENAVTTANPLAVAGLGLITGSDGEPMYGSGGAISAGYKPVVTFHTEMIIPEPAAATLGLLGLAGLMLRRRRA